MRCRASLRVTVSEGLRMTLFVRLPRASSSQRLRRIATLSLVARNDTVKVSNAFVSILPNHSFLDRRRRRHGFHFFRRLRNEDANRPVIRNKESFCNSLNIFSRYFTDRRKIVIDGSPIG